MRGLIEKFYDKIFSDPESKEEVPYANKRLIFWISISSFAIVLFFIIKDILHNIQEINA